MAAGMDRAGAGSGRRTWRVVGAVVCAGALLAAFAAPPRSAPTPERPTPASTTAEFHFPTVPPDHTHARELLANAMRLAAPEHRMTDPASGYPYEGWNHDPESKLLLRNFTQLTAIGLWLELLANVAAGLADTPYLSRDQALTQLTQVVTSLRQDQQDPQLGADGLLGNFLVLSSGRRLGSLTAGADKQTFLAEFGPDKGAAVWKALVAEGWIVPRAGGDLAEVKRRGQDGSDGASLPPFDEATTRKVLALLDRRTVRVVFGDNANLSASAAKAVGVLLLPGVKDRPEAAAVRRELEQFLDAQRAGYARLYDPDAGLFYFGWDGQREQWIGSAGQPGGRAANHMDYLVNEFRGPTTFVVLRYGLPLAAVRNLGFQLKPYRTRAGREVYTLAPWEGSAFQALGLDVSLGELTNPSWRTLLRTAVEIETDYAAQHGLPGFLSESYTGNDRQYSGGVGIPEIAVTANSRITDAASLYSLGAAYAIAPDAVERFLAANWPVLSGLLTDHGPWEGYNVTRREAIRIQTTAHTLALALGLLRNSSDHMARYLAARGLDGRVAELFRPGDPADLLAEDVRVFAWSRKGRPLRSVRDEGGFRITGDRVGEVGMAFVPAGEDGVNLSGGELHIRYRSAGPATPAVVTLKRAVDVPARASVLPQEIFTRIADTGGREQEIRLPLPATPGLTGIKEVAIALGRGTREQAIDLTVTRLRFIPAVPISHRELPPQVKGDDPSRSPVR